MRVALLAVLVLSAPAAALPVFVPRLDADGFPLPRECVRRLGSARFLCGYCTELAYSPDGKTVYVAGAGVSAWDVATGRRKWTADGSAEVHSVAVSADGRAIWAVARKKSGDKYSRPWVKIDTATGVKLLERDLADYASTMRIAANGRVMLSGHSLIEVFDADKEKPVYSRTRPQELAAMWAQDLSADGERLLIAESGAEGKARRILSVAVATGNTVHEWKPPTHGGFRYGPTPDTVTVTVGGAHHTPDTGRQNRPMMLTHWDLKAGKEVGGATLAPSGVRAGGAAAYSPDGGRAVHLINGVPVLFDTATWKRGRELEAVRHVTAVAFSPDGKTLAVGGRGLAFVAVATGKLLHGSAPFADWVDDFHVADGGRTVVGGYGLFGRLRYDVATGKRTVVRDDGPNDLAFGHFVVRDRQGLRQARNVIDMAGQTTDLRQGAVELHAVGQPNVVRELPSSGDMSYEGLDFSDGGRYLLGTQREAVTVWDAVAGGKPLRIEWQPPPGGGSWAVGRKAVACPLDRLVAVHEVNSSEGEAGAWAVGVYELATGKSVQRLSGTGLVYTPLAWSADGTRLALGGSLSRDGVGGGFLSVFDTSARRYTLERAKTEHMLSAICLSPDGRTVIVPHKDDIELVEATTGGLRRAFASGLVRRLAAHPDGRQFATESAVDGVLLWDSLASPAVWPTDADTLWTALGGDASPAHAAIRTLVANPAKALPLLKAKMVELKPLPAERISALVAQLGDKDFATRDAASKELLEHLDDAKPALKAVVADAATTAEAKARAAKLLTQVPPNTPDRLRVLRAVEAGEHIATPDAILLLRAWSAGANVRAAEATAALARLKK